MVKRYEIDYGHECSVGAIEYDEGDFVRHEDYAALEEENVALALRLDDQTEDAVEALKAKLKAIEEAVENARYSKMYAGRGTLIMVEESWLNILKLVRAK